MSPSSNSTNICILCAILGKWLQNCLVKSLIPAVWCISGRYHKNGKGAWCVGFSALACPLATDAQYMTVRQAHIGLHGKSPGWPTGPKQTPYQAEDSCSLTLYTLSNSAQSSWAETLPFQGRPILQTHILCFFLQVLTEHFNMQRLCEAARPGVGISLCQQFHVSADSPTERPLSVWKASFSLSHSSDRGLVSAFQCTLCVLPWLAGAPRWARNQPWWVCAILTLVTRQLSVPLGREKEWATSPPGHSSWGVVPA